MPKISNKINYSITPISFYKFCCNDTTIYSSYVGHTSNFRQRKSSHKSNCDNPNGKAYNLKIYQTIRENGGWDNWNMIEIESKMCSSKRDAERREQTLTEELAADMNMNKSFRTQTKAEYKKQYYVDHLEELKQYSKQYYDEHREDRKPYSKQYYVDHREEINKPIKCDCGCMITKRGLSRHKKTEKHKSLMCVSI